MLRAMRAGFVLGSLLGLWSWPSHAQAEPSTSARGLLADVERIVDAEQSSGWFLDDEAQRSMRGAVIQSVCSTVPAARIEALAELEAAHRARGKPEALFAREGRLTPAVEEALFVERQLLAVRAAVDSAAEQCPFWVRPDPDFEGRQTDRNRFTLSLESGGNAQLRETEGAWTVGGGGLGRLLGGYGFDDGWSLLAGVELGGGAMIRPRVNPTELVINYFPAIPLVVRLRRVAWHYDLETAAVGVFQADNTDPAYGLRGAFGLGVSALETRGVLPWAGAVLAYEYYFAGGGREPQHFLRGGLRIGFVFDP